MMDICLKLEDAVTGQKCLSTKFSVAWIWKIGTLSLARAFARVPRPSIPMAAAAEAVGS